MNGETLIDLYLQDGNPARPIPDVHIPAGSAAAFRLRGLVVDDETTVTVQATNADGTMLTAEAERDGEDFLATFPAANFAAYGVVENGFRVVLVRDGSTFQAAVGNLYIDAQTANAVPGDPEGHAITREELAKLFDDLELADAATQKEVRVALQEIIQKLKGIAGAVAAIAVAVLPAFGDVTPSTVWEEVPPTSVVSHVVRSFAQPTSLAPATNYVDIKTGEIVSNTYTKAETDARIAELAPRTSLEPATNYTDNAVEIAYHDAVDYIERVARRILTTNDVCSIVTNETEGAFGAWASSDEDEYPEYGLVWTGSDEDDPDGFWFFDMYPFERNLGGNYYSTELTMEVDEEQIVKFTRIYTPGRNALGLARRSDIAPTVSNTVTKAYVEGLGIEAGISAENATNIAESVVGATVTGVVRAVSFKVKDYIFDPVTEVCWRRQMVNGFLDYIAVTNIDVTLPENYEALEALERRDNQ